MKSLRRFLGSVVIAAAAFCSAAMSAQNLESYLPANMDGALIVNSGKIISHPLVAEFIPMVQQELQPLGLSVDDLRGRLIFGFANLAAIISTEKPEALDFVALVRFERPVVEKLLAMLDAKCITTDGSDKYKRLTIGNIQARLFKDDQINLAMVAADKNTIQVFTVANPAAIAPLAPVGKNVLTPLAAAKKDAFDAAFAVSYDVKKLVDAMKIILAQSGELPGVDPRDFMKTLELLDFVMGTLDATPTGISLWSISRCKDAPGPQALAEMDRKSREKVVAEMPFLKPICDRQKTTISGSDYICSFDLTNEELMGLIQAGMLYVMQQSAAQAEAAAPAAAPAK